MKYTEDVKLNKAMEKAADMQLSHNEEKERSRNMLLLAIELMLYIKVNKDFGQSVFKLVRAKFHESGDHHWRFKKK